MNAILTAYAEEGRKGKEESRKGKEEEALTAVARRSRSRPGDCLLGPLASLK